MIWVLLAAAVLIVWWIRTSNDFQRKERKIAESLSGIEVALTKRYDMLTKMLDVAKGYAKHEETLFTKTVELRKGMPIGEMNAAAQQMDKLFEGIRVTAEAYPELRSNEVFVQLQQGIADAEEHLQAARRLYNANVTEYNTAISLFPAKLIAGGRMPVELFKAEESKKGDVKMTF